MADRLEHQAQPAGIGASTTAVFDAGLRTYMLAIYNYMASGILLSGAVALLVASNSAIRTLFFSATGAPTLLGWIAVFAPLLLVFAISAGVSRFSESSIKTLFWAYTALMGVSLSTVLLAYTGVSVARTFFISAAAFGALSLWGYTTKKDLSGFGTFLIMGVVGLLIALVVNMFLRSGTLDLVVSGIGVLLFAGLTAYDTQRLKSLYFDEQASASRGRIVVMGALTLYLDFINLFLFLLRFMGNRRQ